MVAAAETSNRIWNDEDLKLIRTGLGTVSKCSSPQEAKIFLANRLLFEINRAGQRKQNQSSMVRVKAKAKQFLKAKQVFGVRCAGWTAAKLESECERALENWAIEAGQTSTASISTSSFNHLADSREAYWKEIHCIGKELADQGATLVLQGSRADNTTTEFSDIDLVLFGDRNSLDQNRLKCSLDAIVVAADSLQHHGVFFYSDRSRQRFSESTLPLDTFKKSTAVADSTTLEFRILNDRYSPAVNLQTFINSISRFLAGEIIVRGMWDWKFKLSQFFLVPALLAATRGQYLYKGESFQAVKPLYSEQAWQAIVDLTRVRQRWVLPSRQRTVSNPYLAEEERVWGRLNDDFWPVPAELAIWKRPEFSVNAAQFIDETLALAGLR